MCWYFGGLFSLGKNISTWVGWNKASTHPAMEEDLPGPVTKKRKGGNQQRLKALEREVGSTAASVKGHSLLADWLKKQWAWGELSPQTVQQISSLAKKDMQAAGALKFLKTWFLYPCWAVKEPTPTTATET